MDVDVDLARVERELEGGQRELVPRQERPVRLQQGLRQERVADHPPVDDEVNVVAMGTGERRRGDDAGHARPRTFARHVEEPGRQPEAVQRADPLPQAGARGSVQEDAPVREEAEVDPRIGQRQLGHDANDGRLLRGGALQELGPRRRVEEQIPDLDGRAGCRVGRARLPHDPALSDDEEPPRRGGGPRQERHPGDGEDGGQRLPAEPERADRVEVGLRPELRGRMPLQREQAVFGGHPAPVVRHRDELAPGAPHRDLDTRRPRVQAVLDQLLDDRRRALDDLPGGDLVDDGVGKALDGRHGRTHGPSLAPRAA